MLTRHVRNDGSRPLGGDRPPDRVRAARGGNVPGPVHSLDSRPLLATLQARDTSSTSITRVALAGTFADEFPLAPNPSAGGTTNRRVPPTRIPGTPTLQNWSVVALPSWRALLGWFAPRVVMTSFPVESQTVNWTFTLDVGVARAPQPMLRSAYCSPEAPVVSGAWVANESEAETGRGVEHVGGGGVI